jgi:hypothetical protein
MIVRHLVLMLVATVAGCVADDLDVHGEPGLPRVFGTIDVAPNVDPTTWTTLEIRFHPNSEEAALWDHQSLVVSTTTLPVRLSIGGDLGVNRFPLWRVTAWLTKVSPPAEAPAPHEPAASTTLVFECEAGCPVQSGIDLVLE